MGRGVEAVYGAVIYRVIQIRLDRDLLAGFVSGVATTMGAIEILKHGAPRLRIALLICEGADGTGEHAVNHSLVVVGIRPPGTRPVPGDSRRIMRPGDPAGNYAARNANWGKGGLEQRGMYGRGGCDREGELPTRDFHFGELRLRKIADDESVQDIRVRPELIVRSSTRPPWLV